MTTIRDITIAFIAALSPVESFLPEVNNFIDFVIHKHQNRIAAANFSVIICLKLRQNGSRKPPLLGSK